MAIIFVYTYNGKLVSFLSVPKYGRVANSLEELADSQSLAIITSRSSVDSVKYLVIWCCGCIEKGEISNNMFDRMVRLASIKSLETR